MGNSKNMATFTLYAKKPLRLYKLINYKYKLVKFRFKYLLAYLFVKVPRPEDSEGTFPVFESSCTTRLENRTFRRDRFDADILTATLFDIDPSNRRSASTQTSELYGLFFALSLFRDERQAGKLWIPTFKVF